MFDRTNEKGHPVVTTARCRRGLKKLASRFIRIESQKRILEQYTDAPRFGRRPGDDEYEAWVLDSLIHWSSETIRGVR